MHILVGIFLKYDHMYALYVNQIIFTSKINVGINVGTINKYLHACTPR